MGKRTFVVCQGFLLVSPKSVSLQKLGSQCQRNDPTFPILVGLLELDRSSQQRNGFVLAALQHQQESV